MTEYIRKGEKQDMMKNHKSFKNKAFEIINNTVKGSIPKLQFNNSSGHEQRQHAR